MEGKANRIYLEKLKQIIESRTPKITQTELANSLKVTGATVSKWLSGETNMKVDTLLKIAEVLNCHISDFFDVKVQNPKPSIFEEALKKMVKIVLTEEKVLNKRE